MMNEQDWITVAIWKQRQKDKKVYRKDIMSTIRDLLK